MRNETSDIEKYECANPLARWLIGRFVGELVHTIRELGPRSVLDVGCGGGHLLELVLARLDSTAVTLSVSDVDQSLAREARLRLGLAAVAVEDGRQLARSAGAFDLVTCTEVLEHVSDPQAVLAELERVTHRFCIVSVPHEPWFRLCTLLRGRHCLRLGNKPGHLHTWTVGRFRRMVGVYFDVLRLVTPFPWIITLCKKRG